MSSDESQPNPRASWGGLPLWGGLAVATVAFLYGWFADYYYYVGDDAAITLRYAERIASGLGFNYNDGEAVNGCSNPLYTLSEAGLLALGLDATRVVRLIASLCLGVGAGVLFGTFARFYSTLPGVFAALAFMTLLRPFLNIYDGLETPYVTLLAVLLFRALHSPRLWPVGIVLGLQVANKLDGGLAAIAFTIVYIARDRRFPLKTALVALLAASPVFLVLLVNFGSIFPNSMATKLTSYSKFWEMDRFWMHKILMREPFRWVYLAAWLSFLGPLLGRSLRSAAPIVVLQIWFVLHMVAYATFNLGAPTGWYASAPRIIAVILAAFALHLLAGAVVESAPRRLDWRPSVRPRRAIPIALAVLLLVGWSQRNEVRDNLTRPTGDRIGLPPSASMDLSRQAAGAWLRRHTSGTETVTCHNGLTAFEYEGPFYDTALLNCHPDEQRRRDAAYEIRGPEPAEAPLEWKVGTRFLRGTFILDRNARRYTVYAKPDSEIVQKGLYHMVFPRPIVERVFPGRDKEPRRLAWRGTTMSIPLPAGAELSFISPEPPTLSFRPFLEIAGKVEPADSAAADHVVFDVMVNGKKLHTMDLAFSGPQAPLQTLQLDRSGNTRYRIRLRTRYGEGSARRTARVALEDLCIRFGDPLEPQDFKLGYDRCRARVALVGERGPPFHLIARR